MAMGLPERRLGLEIFRVDEALDHDLGFRGNEQIDRLRLDDVDGEPTRPPRDIELVDRLRQLLHGGEGDAGRAPSITAQEA